MNFFKKTLMVAIPLLSTYSAHSKETNTLPDIERPEEIGFLNCRNSKIVDDNEAKDTVILFANGIQNSISDAESSRKSLEDLYQCQKCDFRKVYNKKHSFASDTNELMVAGNYQYNAMKNSGLFVLRKIYINNEKYIDNLKKKMGDINENKKFKYLDKMVSIAQLRKENKEFYNELYSEQRKLNALSDKESFLYNPKLHGSSFRGRLHSFMLNKAESSTNKLNLKVMLSITLPSQLSDLEMTFYNNYRSLLTSYYYQNADYYKSDDTAYKRISESVENLQNAITEYVLAGKKVIVVAHSQGNHMIELAYSKLKKSQEAINNPQFMDAIQVVGVASVSASTPNNSYITWDQDHTVLLNYDKISNGSPLKANFINTTSWRTRMKLHPGVDHGFEKVYLSDKAMGNYFIPINIQNIAVYPSSVKDSKRERSARHVLFDLITGAIDSAKPIPKVITTNSVLTAQLRWEKEYDDMDLHIQEPDNSNTVYFSNPIGLYGYLDRDDTDYEGPEHYFVNKLHTCDDLANKEWNVYIKQYPMGGFPSVAHLMIKIGDNKIVSRSFAYKKWPSDKVHVATISFNKTKQYVKSTSNQLDYVIQLK